MISKLTDTRQLDIITQFMEFHGCPEITARTDGRYNWYSMSIEMDTSVEYDVDCLNVGLLGELDEHFHHIYHDLTFYDPEPDDGKVDIEIVLGVE